MQGKCAFQLVVSVHVNHAFEDHDSKGNRTSIIPVILSTFPELVLMVAF